MRRIPVESSGRVRDWNSLSCLLFGKECGCRSEFEHEALQVTEPMVIEVRHAASVDPEVMDALESIQQKSAMIYVIRG